MEDLFNANKEKKTDYRALRATLQRTSHTCCNHTDHNEKRRLPSCCHTVGKPCSGEEELMRVRYVSPLFRLTSDGWNLWLGVWLVVCFCLGFWFGVFGLLFVWFVFAFCCSGSCFDSSIHLCLHTKDMKLMLV